MVELPKVAPTPDIGESRGKAVQRFKQNERTLQRKGKLDAFNDMLKEYIELDHAEPVPDNDKAKLPPEVYYLPIHGVFKDSSTTTKRRAVSTHRLNHQTESLNDVLEAGPNLYLLCSSDSDGT